LVFSKRYWERSNEDKEELWINPTSEFLKMAGAAGGFVTRAFDAMLKESSGKKLTSLQSAIQSYLGL